MKHRHARHRSVCRLLPLVLAVASACTTHRREPQATRTAPDAMAPAASAPELEASATAEVPPAKPAPAAPPSAAAAKPRPGCGMPKSLVARGWQTELAPTTQSESPDFVAGSTTLVVLPDTQYYSDCASRYFADQTRWTKQELEQRNIRAVLTLGDLTDKNTEREWRYLKQGLGSIENDVPVVLVSGNHDTGDRGTSNRRTASLARQFPAPPGVAKQALAETARPGDIENAYYRITLPRVTLGVLALEWSPRSSVIGWANRVLEKHPKDRVIVLTHAYLYDDGTRYDWWKKGSAQEWNPLSYQTAKRDKNKSTTAENLHPEGAHDGEMLWNELVKKHPGIFLVLSGHVLGRGAASLESRGDHGNTVLQVLANYQMLKEGGLGYLRLVELLPDGRTLRQKTYSPSLGVFATAAEQSGDLRIDPPLW